MSLSLENIQVINLVQAMIGSISPNIRRVSMSLDGDGVSSVVVRVQFVLEHESSDDREEIDDVEFEFCALQMQAVETQFEVEVDSRPLAEIESGRRIQRFLHRSIDRSHLRSDVI